MKCERRTSSSGSPDTFDARPGQNKLDPSPSPVYGTRADLPCKSLHRIALEPELVTKNPTHALQKKKTVRCYLTHQLTIDPKTGIHPPMLANHIWF